MMNIQLPTQFAFENLLGSNHAIWSHTCPHRPFLFLCFFEEYSYNLFNTFFKKTLTIFKVFLILLCEGVY
jgi:hypothetical protein